MHWLSLPTVARRQLACISRPNRAKCSCKSEALATRSSRLSNKDESPVVSKNRFGEIKGLPFRLRRPFGLSPTSCSQIRLVGYPGQSQDGSSQRSWGDSISLLLQKKKHRRHVISVADTSMASRVSTRGERT
jgi:hypothetical protein